LQIVYNFFGVDSRQTGSATPVAANTYRVVGILRKSAIVMIEPVFQSVLFDRPEVVPAGDFRKVYKIARLLDPLLARTLETHIDVLLDPVAIAGGTNHRTTAAIEAFLAPFLPDRRFEFYVQDTRQTGDFDLGLEAVSKVLSSLMELRTIAVNRIAGLEVLEKSERLGGAYRQVVTLTYIGAEQIESAMHGVLAERFAEAVVQRFVIHAHEEGVCPSRHIVWRRIGPSQKDLIQYAQGIDITGSYADDHSRIDSVLDRLVPALVGKIETGKLLPERQEEILHRRVCDRIVQVHLVEGTDLFELVDSFAVGPCVDQFRAECLIVSNQTIDEFLKLYLRNYFMDHLANSLERLQSTTPRNFGNQ
jgi:hypothetical protein